MAYWSIQIRDGQPEKDPSDIKELILGKSSSGWSTSNLRSTPVQPAISDPASSEKEEDNISFVTTSLRGETQKNPALPLSSKDKNKSSFTSVPLKDQIKEREDVHYPSVMGKVTSEVRQAITSSIPVKPQKDPIEAYLDKFISLSEIKKVSTPELMWISQFIEGESREKQIYLLRELKKIEGALPAI